MRDLHHRAAVSGALGSLLLALLLVWHWRAERQVRLHSEHFLRAVESHAWDKVSAAVAADYRDQWANDRALFLEQLPAAMRFFRGVKFEAESARMTTSEDRGAWSAKIRLHGGDESAAPLLERVNASRTPFELQWRRQSARPWDWQLVRIENPDLVFPDGTP